MKKLVIAIVMTGAASGAYAADLEALAVSAADLKTASQLEGTAINMEKTRLPAVGTAAPGDRQTELLNAIEGMKEKIRKYSGDPVRTGIYHAELSLLYVELANTHSVEKIRVPDVKTGGPGDRRAELLNAIEAMKEKIRKYSGDPARAGIYHAEISLLYVELANTHSLEKIRLQAAKTAAPGAGNSVILQENARY